MSRLDHAAPGETVLDARNTIHAQGADGYDFLAEASDLRLPPGGWPRSLPTTLGTGRRFYLQRQIKDAAGELLGVEYRQADATGNVTGPRLMVYND